jgi:hypothetical protein
LECGIDSYLDAFAPQGDFGFITFEDVEGRMTEDGKIEGREILAAAATILVKGYIQLPMKVVLDTPMRPRSREDDSWVCG